MFLGLDDRVVLVDGPYATGIYDLKRGAFHRVSLDAGRFLRTLDGTVERTTLSKEEKKLVAEALSRKLLKSSDAPDHQPQTSLQDVIKPRRPVRFAWLEITSKCNQKCLHCFVGDQLNKYPHVPLDRIIECVEVLNRLGARQIVLSGGEPTIHPQFREILDEIGKTRMRIAVLTNASSRRVLGYTDSFLTHGVTVKIPMLGWGRTHDVMAGPGGSFVRTKDAIEKLNKAGVHLQIGTTVTALNYKDISKIRDFALEIGVPLEASPIFGIGWARDNASTLTSIPMDKIIEVCKENSISTASTTQATPVRFVKNGGRYKSDPRDYEAVDLQDFLTEHHECGQKIVAVLANGCVTPCLLLRETPHVLGSLHTNTLEAILTQSVGPRENFDNSMRLSSIPQCNECEARFVCKAGGCPASAYAMTGLVNRKNPLYDKCYYENNPAKSNREQANFE